MRYDKRDPDPQVIKLTRAGHYLWARLKNRKSPLPDEQRGLLYEALEILWRLKREIKDEMAERRSAQWQEAKRKFAGGTKLG